MTKEQLSQSNKSELDVELEARRLVSEESQYASNGGIGHVGYAALHLECDASVDEHLVRGEN